MNDIMKNLLSAFDEFKTATIKLDELLGKAQAENTDLLFCEEYPFELSFDELTFEIINWVDTQKFIVKGEMEND